MDTIVRIFDQLRLHTYSYLKNQTTPFTYVAMGDSTAEGMGATSIERGYANLVFLSLKERYRQAKYSNIARSGAVLADVEKGQLKKAIDAKPTLITISIGANDIIARTKLEEFEKRLYSILKELHEGTNALIVISTVPDLSLAPAVPKLLKTYSKYKAGKLNQIIRTVAKKTNTTVVDLFEQSRSILRAYPEAVASDGWHPSDFGYALWANSIIVTLQNVLAPVPVEEDPVPEEK